MKFLGRTAERKRLNDELSETGQNATLVYGRRRIGKSELIATCLADSKARGIYYECKQTAEANNVQSLAQVLSEEFGLPRLAFTSMEELLEFTFAQAREEKLILVLDEYPYLRACVRGLDSILQSLLDKHRNDSQLNLVLCGSYIDVMKSLVDRHNPLYGRIDLTIDLQPMDYYDAALFYPGFSDADKVALYSVFGGVPYYNRRIDSAASVEENIIELIASSDARFANEIPSFLSSEISKVANANEVFGALAQGFSKYKDILDQSHVSSGPALVDTLDKLMRMGVVQKDVPLNAPGNRRRARYKISDRLSLFYYRYNYQYLSQMAVMSPEAFFARFVQRDFETQFVPHAFEEVCRQFLIRKNRQGGLGSVFDSIGSYYYDDPETKTNGEFDVVTHDDRGYVFYEAKFTKSPITDNVIREEIRQVETTGVPCSRFGFFARSGFDVSSAIRDDDAISLVSLDEMY